MTSCLEGRETETPLTGFASYLQVLFVLSIKIGGSFNNLLLLLVASEYLFSRLRFRDDGMVGDSFLALSFRSALCHREE